MSKYLTKIFIFLSLINFISCSSTEEQKLSPKEITNLLLVNEQIPIQAISNALEWPKEVIMGVNLGIIELNDDGIEKISDVFKEYSDENKQDFIEDYKEKEWSKFVKEDWIKNEKKLIPNSKLNEIKVEEFKNNKIIQEKLDNFIPNYVENQTKKLSSYHFSPFSIGFWKNLTKSTWMHIKSIYGKVTHLQLTYLKPEYVKELNIYWDNEFNNYFSTKEVNLEMNNILKNYSSLTLNKHIYLSKLLKKKVNPNFFPSLTRNENLQLKNIDIRPIINLFNLTLFNDILLEVFELLFEILIVASIVNYFLRRIANDNHESKNHIVTTFFKTGISPVKVAFGSLLYLGQIVIDNNNEVRRNKIKSTGRTIEYIIGLLIILFSSYYFPKNQEDFENEIDKNFKSNFSSHYDKSSFFILEYLDLSSELFFKSVK